MLPKEIEEREIQYLNNLLKTEQIETKRLEVKSTLRADTRDEKIEFLADVSSLANTAGGELIIGLEQSKETGKIAKITGIEIANVDQEIQRLENIMNDGLKPRILAKEIFPISWADSKIVLIIRIPQSMISPHRVIYGGHEKFYGRNSNGKYPLDIDELRVAFTYSQTVTEKIKEFRFERIAKIVANSTPIPLEEGPKRIIHIIPINSLSSFNQYDISNFYGHPAELDSLAGPSWDVRYNLDGIISFCRPGRNPRFYSFLQIYRTGIIEVVRMEAVRDDHFIITEFERDMVGTTPYSGDLRCLLGILQEIGVPPNFFFFITILGLKGFQLATRNFEADFEPPHRLDRDLLSLPELSIDRFDIDPGKLLRSHFNLLWNAWGYPYSPNYKEGKWGLRP